MIFKEAYVMFQDERVGTVYILRNADVTVGGLQLSSASKVVVVEQLKTTDGFEFRCSIVPRREIGTKRATR